MAECGVNVIFDLIENRWVCKTMIRRPATLPPAGSIKR